MTIINDLDLDDFTLKKGAHGGFNEGACLLEAVAYVAGEPFSDHPECASSVLGVFGRQLNDALGDDKRQQLKPFIPQMVGTCSDGLDETRSYLALDWLIRTYTPAWLDLAGLTAEATALRDLRRIVDMAAAQAAGPVVRAAKSEAAAAGSAARGAAWDAAWDAAGAAARGATWDAAWGAARDAAGDAAGAAAWDAAWGAAWGAARDAAGDKLRPTVENLQDSSIALFAEMIRPATVTG